MLRFGTRKMANKNNEIYHVTLIVVYNVCFTPQYKMEKFLFREIGHRLDFLATSLYLHLNGSLRWQMTDDSYRTIDRCSKEIASRAPIAILLDESLNSRALFYGEKGSSLLEQGRTIDLCDMLVRTMSPAPLSPFVVVRFASFSESMGASEKSALGIRKLRMQVWIFSFVIYLWDKRNRCHKNELYNPNNKLDLLYLRNTRKNIPNPMRACPKERYFVAKSAL